MGARGYNTLARGCGVLAHGWLLLYYTYNYLLFYVTQ